jgi:hypothetical protein
MPSGRREAVSQRRASIRKNGLAVRKIRQGLRSNAKSPVQRHHRLSEAGEEAVTREA